MSDSQDKSDDLIAELAKLMASNAQGSESEPKPTVIKLPPLSEATVPPPAPIRIPGMDGPAVPGPAAAQATAPAVRIPGMEKPAGVDMPAPAPSVPPQAKPQPTAPFDFGKPPVAAPVAAPEPLNNWQTRDVPKPPAVAPTPPAEARVEPALSTAPVPAAMPSPASVEAKPAAAADDFNFDFGFGSKEEVGAERPAAEVEAPAKATAPSEHDPIADLIAAELDAAQAEPVQTEPAKVATAPAAAVFPASVQAVPARSFGNTTAGQAPVLIARPAVMAASRATPTAPVSFRPIPQPAKPAESDKFAVAPVFGLGSRPAPSPQAAAPAPAAPPRPVAPAPVAQPAPVAVTAPRRDIDPMDEIENLIGEAVRTELSGGEKPAAVKPAQIQAPQVQATPVQPPVVPPLTTGFAPRRAGLKDNEPQMKSAEAAILAAAAATGAEVGRIDADARDDRPYKRMKMKPQRANMFGGVRQYVGLAVAGTLLLAAGFGLYWVLGMGRGDATAPVLTADTTPAKQAPAVVAASTAEPSRSVVFDEIDGVAAVDSAETLVSRDETAGTDVAEVARVVTPEASEDSTESGLANRKVRTVTVRPDGTIVSGDEAVAGTEALPVERPNVPTVPGAATEPSDLLTAAATETNAAAIPTEIAETDPIAAAIAAGETAESNPIEVAALVPENTTPPVFDASIVAPTPMPRPVDRNSLGAASATTAAVEPNAPAELPLVDLAEEPATQTASVSSGGAVAYVQVSSQRSEAEAQASLRSVQSRFGSLLGGNSLEIQRADLGQKGIYYRVKLPTGSLQEATSICASIKANGGDCFASGG